MATKLVKDVDDSVWRNFTSLCKMENQKVGIKLSKILDDYFKKKVKVKC